MVAPFSQLHIKTFSDQNGRRPSCILFTGCYFLNSWKIYRWRSCQFSQTYDKFYIFNILFLVFAASTLLASMIFIRQAPNLNLVYSLSFDSIKWKIKGFEGYFDGLSPVSVEDHRYIVRIFNRRVNAGKFHSRAYEIRHILNTYLQPCTLTVKTRLKWTGARQTALLIEGLIF